MKQQNSVKRRSSIQVKIAFWTGLSMLVAATVIIAYAATSVRAMGIESAKGKTLALAEENAATINEEIEVTLTTVRTIADILASEHGAEHPLGLDRKQVSHILQLTLEENPNFVGMYTLWESDAFDGQDRSFRDDALYGEEGHFAVYWSRSPSGDVMAEPFVFDSTDENAAMAYLCPKETRLECISSPHSHVVQGDQTLVISMVEPIIFNGEYYGMVGADIGLDFFQRIADSIDLYDGTAQMSLISYDGILVAVTGQPEIVGMSGNAFHSEDFDQDIAFVQQGQKAIDFHSDGALEVFVPIHFLRVWTPWSVNLVVPNEKIIADATGLMWQMIGIGVFMTFAALALIWLITRKITQPIQEVTQVAQRVADGNLDVEVPVASKDEIGLLAEGFNRMIGNLRQMMEKDRQSRNELEEQNAQQQQLLDLVSTLETPAISLMDGVLFSPVVGSMDSQRTQNLMERLLQDVYKQHVRHVILDITGVVTVDTQVAHAIHQLVQALRLLGCRVTITGISAAVATTITQLGVNLEGVETYHSPQEVLVQLFTMEQRNNHL